MNKPCIKIQYYITICNIARISNSFGLNPHANPQSVVRLFFDILHGIEKADVPLEITLEFAIFLGYDGQLEQKSGMETHLFRSVIDQLKKTEMTNLENAMMWVYVKSWGLKGEHVLNEASLWNFGGEDLEAALIKTGYIKKKDSTERMDDLKKLIIDRFEDINEFFNWSRSIHSEVKSSFYHLICKKYMINQGY